jgi:hypothetical protein
MGMPEIITEDDIRIGQYVVKIMEGARDLSREATNLFCPISKILSEAVDKINMQIYPDYTDYEKTLQTIPAIKAYRERTGAGLRVAKAKWDLIRTDRPKEV